MTPKLPSAEMPAAPDEDYVADVVAVVVENLVLSGMLVSILKQIFAPVMLCKLVVNSAEAEAVAAQDSVILENYPNVASAIYSAFTQFAESRGLECTKSQYDALLSFILQWFRENPQFASVGDDEGAQELSSPNA